MRSGESVMASGTDSLTYSRPCRNPQAAATYTSPHWTTLRRRSLAQALSRTLCRRVGHSAAPMASECSGPSAGARGKRVHSDLKAGHAWSFLTWAAAATPRIHPAVERSMCYLD